MKYFKREEFVCPCCGVEDMQETFLNMLDIARGEAGVSFTINSGYRCKSHNAEVGGATHSSHTTGYGVDISCTSTANRFKIVNSLLARGFNRIGIANSFIHVDCDPSLPCKVIWVY
jgi:zinc D-Ala-D-Ala carboxypeptidase